MTDAQMLLWPFLRWILAPLTILGIGYGIYRLLRAGIRGIFLAAADRVPGAEGDPGRERTVQRLETLRKLSVEVLRLALIVLFGLTFLRSLGLDLAPLLAGVGVVGLGVTLAAQSLLKDYLNGILILVENQYNVGDTVEINGLTGTVERLWLRLTTLRLIDGRLAFIPNGQILTVVNQTKDWSAARVEIGVPSDADVSRAVELIDACVRALAEERAEALRESEARYRALFESAGDGILLLGADGRIVDCNRRLEELFRMPRDLLLGAHPGELSPDVQPDGELSPEMSEGYIGRAGGGFPQFFPWRHRRGDGTLFDCEISLKRVDSEGGALMQGIVRDVSERLRAEEALRESEAKLRRAEEIGRLGHTSVDLRTGRCVWSEELYRIFGVPPEEGPLCADAERLRRLVHPEDRESLDRQMAAALAGEGQTLEYRILRPDGEIRHATATLEVQRDEAGHPLSLFATVQDTTELKRRERELREKNAELERFTYTISHDLKSPLVTVKTFLGYLEEDLRGPDPERVLQDLRYIRTAADKMSRLLDELLEMSRAGRTLSPPTRAPFRELVREALEAVAGRLAERGVQVRVATDPTVLFGDRPRLTAIWQNLIENAAKYMGDQADPVVEIEAEGSGREKVFTVRDNGMGIDPRYRGKIFGLFEKLDPRSEGTGFGLALVRRIVEYYGGTIEVESPGEGGGSLFRFTLPGAIREEDNPEAPPGTGEMEPLWPEAEDGEGPGPEPCEAEEAGARGNGVWGVVSAEPEAGSGDARKADGRERTR